MHKAGAFGVTKAHKRSLCLLIAGLTLITGCTTPPAPQQAVPQGTSSDLLVPRGQSGFVSISGDVISARDSAGSVIWSAASPSGTVMDVRASQDGSTIALVTISDSGIALSVGRIGESSATSRVRSWPLKTAGIVTVSVSPSGDGFLVTGSGHGPDNASGTQPSEPARGWIERLDSKGAVVWRFDPAQDEFVQQAVASSDLSRVVVVTSIIGGSTGRVLALDGGRIAGRATFNGYAIAAISGDGTRVAIDRIGDATSDLAVYRAPDLRHSEWATATPPVSDLQYDTSGRLLLAASTASEVSSGGAERQGFRCRVTVFGSAGTAALVREIESDAMWVANLSRTGSTVIVRPLQPDSSARLPVVVADLSGPARVETSSVDAAQAALADDGSRIGLVGGREKAFSVLPTR